MIFCLEIDSMFVTTGPIVFGHRVLLLRDPTPSQTRGPEMTGRQTGRGDREGEGG